MEPKQIDRNHVQDIIGLTPMQDGMLFHYVNPQDREYYFEQLCVRLEGNVQAELVQQVWLAVISSNESLRSVFRWRQLKVPLQIVLKKWNFLVHHLDCSHMPADQREDFLFSLKQADRQQGFDLTEVPFRVTLCKESEQRYSMIVSNHHILYDGWSNGIILKEFLEAYEQFHQGKPFVPLFKTSNKEYLKYLQSQSKPQQEVYWRSYLSDFESKSLLPAVHSQIAKDASSKTYVFQLSAETTSSLTQFVRRQKLTLAALVYTAWGILLQRYTNSSDAVFGTTVSGRTDKVQGMESMVGLFINTIPMRVQTEQNEPVSRLLQRMEEMLRVRGDYEATPLVDIHSYSEIDKREGLFESVLVFENYPLDSTLQDKDRVIRYTSFEMSETTHFDLLLSVHTGEQLAFDLQYAAHKFEPEMIGQVCRHFTSLLMDMMNRPAALVSELNLLTEQDKRQLLVDFNANREPISFEETVQQRFEAQVALTPHHPAIICGEETLTYEQLNKRSNVLAHYLRSRQVGPERVVGILLDRSADVIVSMLAVLKAGGAYMPIDTDYPADRIQYMLDESQCMLLLTQAPWPEKLVYADKNIVLVPGFGQQLDDPGNPISVNQMSDMAYVIYTSGSTGKPKGIMLEHRNMISFIYSFIYNQLLPQDRGLVQASISFDTSAEEIYPLLLRGGTLIILPKADVLDTDRLVRWIKEERVTFLTCSPHLVNQLNDRLTDYHLRLLVSGGDVLKQSYYSNLRDTRIYNSYGPSEATVAVTYYECPFGQREETVPIGGPIANRYFAVVDRVGRLQPIGAAGELWIAGASIARGYINRPEMTMDRFGESPYFPGERMYKTGDMVRWLPEGTLEYMGRMDDQVKIRGYRIELGEIECALLVHEGIEEAAVLACEVNQGHEALCAYYTGVMQPGSTLRSFLQERLPDYMIPSYYVHLEKLPLTINGKLDRKVLPEPAIQRDETVLFAIPSNDIEQRLMHIWQELLSVEKISIHDNFFEIGGDSILLMRMQAQVDIHYPNQVTITDLFAYTNISKLAQFIAGAPSDAGRIQLEPVLLPLEFFSREPGGTGREIATFTCSQSLYSKLTLLAKEEGLGTQDIALGMFIYLLQQFSEQQSIQVQAILSQMDMVTPVKVDFGEMQDFLQFFHEVKQSSEIALSTGAYSLQASEPQWQTDLSPLAVMPLFVKAGLLSRTPRLTQHYDLVLEYREVGAGLEFSCEYNGSRLRKSGVEDLVNGYVQLLTSLVEQYEFVG